MSGRSVSVEFLPTPEQLAEAFWHLGSDQQADFYAHLYRVAGHKLCLQTAWIVDEISQRQARGDWDAVNGFRTLHSHAEAYMEVLADTVARQGSVARAITKATQS